MDMMTNPNGTTPMQDFYAWCQAHSCGEAADRFAKKTALTALDLAIQLKRAPDVEGLTDAVISGLPGCRGSTKALHWLQEARDAYLAMNRLPAQHVDEVEREAVAQVLEDLAQRVQAVAAAVREGRSAIIAAVAAPIDRLFP
jgi:hypothetical protein